MYGYNLIELSKQLQLEIKQTLKNMLDLDNVKVDVHIEGIVKEKGQLHMVTKSEIDVKHVNTHFKCYMLMNFIPDQSDVQFPEGHIHKSMDKAYANNIINGVLSSLKIIDQHYSHFVNHVKLKLRQG